MAPRGTTKRRILDLAENLLQRLGYNGFSYQHLSKELGIKNAAIHYHFPTKEELGVEIIERTPVFVRILCLTLLSMVILLFMSTGEQDFIYFQF